MAKPINLNKVRKLRDRAVRKAQADKNAVTFGRSKAERDLDAARVAQDKRRLDQAKRDEE